MRNQVAVIKDLKMLGETQMSLGAPPEVKVLVALRNFLQEVLLEGLICPDVGLYPKVTTWMQGLSLLDLDRDLLTTSPRRGSRYRRFLRSSVREFTGWVQELREVAPEDSCNGVIETYCPLHQVVHIVTTEEAFSVRLVEYLGFLRCVCERDEDPLFEIEGEEEGILSYRAMIEEEWAWREQKRRVCGDPV